MITLQLLYPSLGGVLVAPEILTLSPGRPEVVPASLAIEVVVVVVALLLVITLVIVALLVSLLVVPLILVPPSASSPAALKASPARKTPSSAAPTATALESASRTIKVPPPIRLRSVLIDVLVKRVGSMGLLIEEFFCFVCIEMPTVGIEKATLPIVAEFFMPRDGTLPAVLISIITISALVISTVLAPGLAAFIPAVTIVAVLILALSALIILAVFLFLVLEMHVPVTLELVCYLHRIQRVIGVKRVNVLLIC